ncbi:MAG: hypothetical protein JRI68_33880, partial [Deltaproteobacteria bacterium]|nr:hypothetical protein [Deltaproteobacteria bacterium]
MGAETVYRLPGEVQLYVGLTDSTAIDPSDPRAKRPVPDDSSAAEALKEFAGPAALRVGGLLVETLEKGALDKVIEVLYRFCERLEELGTSPIGRGTAAAKEAADHAAKLRQGALSLSVPPGHPGLGDAVKQVLDQLEAMAKQYGAWPEEHQGQPSGDYN